MVAWSSGDAGGGNGGATPVEVDERAEAEAGVNSLLDAAFAYLQARRVRGWPSNLPALIAGGDVVVLEEPAQEPPADAASRVGMWNSSGCLVIAVRADDGVFRTIVSAEGREVARGWDVVPTARPCA